ncbi:MAG: hypothetical protein K8T89_27115 [Planctomycetes bacterium]|nr:hypothetical protein [Planctomycetota bacterium]
MSQWKDKTDEKERTKITIIIDRETGKEKIVELPGKDLTVIGWKQTDAGLRCLAMTNRWRIDKKEPSDLYSIDPITGELKRQDADARTEVGISPDGKRRVRVGKDDLIVTEIESGKEQRFVFHEDDQRFVGEDCVQWVSPRYLKFNGRRLALIDVTRMKMCILKTADEMKVPSHICKFSSDFRWVLYQGETADGDALLLAPVEAAKDK